MRKKPVFLFKRLNRRVIFFTAALVPGFLICISMLFAANTITSMSNSPDPVQTGNNTTISFTLGTADDTQVVIKDSGGTWQKRFYSDNAAISFSQVWNTKDDAGANLAVGTYTAEAKVGFVANFSTKIEGTGISYNRPRQITTLSNGSFIVVNRDDASAMKFSSSGALLVRFVSTTPTDKWVGVAVDPSGNVYFGNNTTNAIEKWASTGTLVSATWATNAAFNTPVNLSQDATYLYVVQNNGGLRTVFRVDFATPTSFVDIGFTGTAVFSNLRDVALDSAGNIYCLDRGGKRLEKYDSVGAFIADVGVGGTAPNNIYIDSQDTIYMLDSGSNAGVAPALKRYNTSLTQTGFMSTTFTYSSGDGEFKFPNGLAVWYDSTNTRTQIYIADTQNNRTQTLLDTGGVGAPTFSQKTVNDPNNTVVPTDIFIDSSDNIFVTLELDHVAKKFSATGQLLLTIGGFGETDGLFNRPQGIVLDSLGNIYVSDWGTSNAKRGRIQKFNSSGVWQSTIVSQGVNKRYYGMTIDSSDNIYVAAQGSDVYKYNTAGTQLAANLAIGGNASDIAVSWDGKVYALRSNRIRRLNNNAGLTFSADIVTGLTTAGCIAVDEFGNVIVSHNDNIRKYNPAGTLLGTWGGNGSGDGQFIFPDGTAFTTDYSAIWIADSNVANNRLQKFDIVWDATQTDTITINNGSAGAPIINDIVLSDLSPTKAGVVTFQVVFDQPMNTTVTPTVKFIVNGQETSITQSTYSNNIWTGTATVSSGNDGTATLSVAGAVDNDSSTAQNPDPDTSNTFVIDTTAPSAPTITQPSSPTTKIAIPISGTAEANTTVAISIYDAATAGTLISSQTGIPVDGVGSWTSNDLSINVGNNYIEATNTDSAGNVSTATSPRIIVERVLSSPGTASISPTTTRQLGFTGTWTLTYTADSEMTNGTVTIDIPTGWTAPTLTSSVAGYVTVGNSTITGASISSVSGQTITIGFTSSTSGDSFDLVYGDISGGGPGGTISSSASLGANAFVTKSANNDPGNDGEPFGIFNSVPSPQITVFGVDVKVLDTSQAPAGILKGQSDVKMLSLKFTNDNVTAGDEIQSLVFTVENSANTGIVPNTMISRIVVKDLSQTYVTDTTIENSGTTITLDLTATPISMSAGQNKTVDVYIDILSSATAGQTVKLNLNASSDVTARDENSQVIIGVTADAGTSFPMRSSHSTVAASVTADELLTSTASAMPTNITRGQTSLKVMTFSFDDVKTGGTDPNAIDITQLVLTVEDNSNTPIIPNSVLSNIKLQAAGGGQVFLSRTVTESAANGKITLDLSITPINVVFGAGSPDLQVDVIVNLKSTTTATSLQLNLNASTDITAKDAVDSTAIATYSGVFPQRSSAATVQIPAAIKVKTIALNPTVSMVLGDALVVTVTMEYVSGQSSASLIDAATDLAFNIAGDITSEFSVTPRAGNPATLAPPATTTVDLIYDVIQDGGTTSGVMTVDSSATGPVARDANDDSDADPLVITDTNGADTTDSVTVNASSADATVTAVPASTPGSGAANVLVLDFTITNNTGSADSLTQIKLTSKNGSDVDVANVQIFKESNASAGYQSAGDTLELTSGTNTFSGGSLILNVSANNSVPANGAQQFYVVYDLATSVTDGNALDMEIPINGLTLTTAGTIESFILDSTGTVSINVVATEIKVASSDNAAAVGGTDLLTIKALDANGNIDTGSSLNVTITLTDPANPSANSSTVSATTLSGGSTGSASTNGTLSSGQATVTITDAETETATITPSSALGTNTSDTVVFSQQMAATANAVSDTSPAPGATQALILDVAIDNATGVGDTITNITIQSLNTSDTNVTDIDIYVESGATAGFQPAQDTQELTAGATDTFASGSAAFTFSLAIADGTSKRLYITYDLSTTGTDNNTLDAKIPINGITLTTAGLIDTSVLNSAGTVTLEVVATKIVVTATDGTASPGQTEVCFIKAQDANNNLDADSSQQVQITLDGSAKVNATTLTGGATGGSLTTGTLTNGEATVTVEDSVGEVVNVTPSSALGTNTAVAVTFEADVTAPAAPTITVDGNGAIPNSPSSDTTPTVAGSAEADSTVKIYNGTSIPGNLIGTGTATGAGTFSITVSALATGIHTGIRATATDQALNVSPDSTTATYEVIAGSGSFSGTIEGFPTMALDWNTFVFYGGYVSFRNINGANDDKISVLNTSGADTGFSFIIPEANGDIVGIPIWDTEATKVIFFGTTTGNVYKAEHLAAPPSALTVVAGFPTTDAGNIDSVTSSFVTDRNSLFFGGTDAGSPKVFVFDLGTLTVASPPVTAISSVQSFPSLFLDGATTYAMVGSTSNGVKARISKVNDTVEVGFDTGVNADITAGISITGGSLYVGDLNGRIYKLNPSTMTHVGSVPFYNAASAVKGSVLRDFMTNELFFGDASSKVHRMDSNGTAIAGWPKTYGTSTFETGGRIVNGVFYIGNTNGKLYGIDVSTGNIAQIWNLGAGAKIGNVAYAVTLNSLIIGTSAGDVFLFTPVADPTP